MSSLLAQEQHPRLQVVDEQQLHVQLWACLLNSAIGLKNKLLGISYSYILIVSLFCKEFHGLALGFAPIASSVTDIESC